MKISTSVLLTFIFSVIALITIVNSTAVAENEKNLADSFFYNNQYHEAVSNYLKVLEDDETNPELLFRVGLCYLMLGQHVDALQFWGAALEVNPGIADKWYFHFPADSMEPTIIKGDKVIVDQEFYDHNEISRGDVVLFIYPKDTKEVWIKRVIGLPGDKVLIKNKKVFINWKKLTDESYTIFSSTVTLPANVSPKDNFGPVEVPSGHYFVLGDNRDNSSDSRFWGYVKRDYIIGKALVIFGTASTNQSPSGVNFERMGRIIK